MSLNPPVVTATVCTDRGIYSGKLLDAAAAAAAAGPQSASASGRTIVAPTAAAAGVDSNDPAVRRVVYNLYRGLLGNYNDKANDILSSMPADRVREDRGITQQLESMM